MVPPEKVFAGIVHCSGLLQLTSVYVLAPDLRQRKTAFDATTGSSVYGDAGEVSHEKVVGRVLDIVADPIG